MKILGQPAVSRGMLLCGLTGAMILLLAISMVPCILIALYDNAPDLQGFQLSAAASAIFGLVLLGFSFKAFGKVQIGHREGFLIVAGGWICAGLIGALPFWFYAHFSPDQICDALIKPGDPLPVGYEFCSFTNSAFESFAGFSTTGASILQDGLWESADGLMANGQVGLPRGLLLWRSLTQWLGGMGIIVLGVAILPLLGVGGMQLLRAEVPGPTTDKLAPRIKETARLLYQVYIIFTLAEFVLLLFGGMTPFESVCQSFATMSTGGFSTRGTSIASFHSPYIEWVICLFMFLGGVNFSLHFALLQKRWIAYFKDPEFRIYCLLVFGGIGVASFALCHSEHHWEVWDAIRSAAFQSLSIMTTTGFATDDYAHWNYAPGAVSVIVACMFTGAMAGSTSGGPKIVRIMLAFKYWFRDVFLLIHPKAKKSLLLAEQPVSEDVLRSSVSFIIVYITIFVFGTFAFVGTGLDLKSSFSASIASLGNIGPGFSTVGPCENYYHLTDVAKWVSILLQLFGRLEIYTLLVLFSPTFWRR